MLKTKSKVFILLLTLVVVFASGCGKQDETVLVSGEMSKKISETISLVAVGDNLLHMPVINSGKKADGTYDYSPIFQKLQPQIREADISVIGQETVFAGKEFGYSGYPLFNSPADMGRTLVGEGFDVVLHASNHVMDKLSVGVENTLNFWKDYPEVTVLGINETELDMYKVCIKEVKGAKLALLNYTYGTNGILVPSDKSYLVNLIDEEKIHSDARYAEENADFTIAFMHWGTEYSLKPDEYQKSLAEKMCLWGVDLIIGAHPHVIEPVEWYENENGNKMLVYYSLGNFVSRQKEVRNLLGGLADVKLKYDGDSVSISSYSFVPIVTHYNIEYNKFDVYRLKDYKNEIAMGHGVAQHDGAVTVERFKSIIDETFDGYDKNIIEW